jgi:hypothetical protein
MNPSVTAPLSSTPVKVGQPLYRVVMDLTGKVVKAAAYCFARGGNADLWKGVLVTKDSPQAVEVLLF